MIKDFKPILGAGFPADVEIKSASGAFPDMGARTINLQCRFDGQTTPDFSKDWEFIYKDNKYIMPLREPQGAKGNETISASSELPFQHWAEYWLQQKYFFEPYSTQAGQVIPDKFVASVNINLSGLCDIFKQVLKYWFGDKITLDIDQTTLNDASKDVQKVEISYAHVWDVLLKLHELYGVRWQIDPNGDADHYVIKIRYGSQVELSHIFEYGFKGGLLNVERQVQNPEIKNVLLGRGGDKNLPYRYFKDKDPNNPSFPADPDWIPELAQMPFTQLRGATFRSYIRGWKAKHYGGTTTAADCYAPWAWEKGYNDEKFDPVEYVRDEDSIALYGELWDALEDNAETYPSIEKRVRAGIGRVDEVVAVEPIISDDYVEKSEKESQQYNANPCSPNTEIVKGNSTATIKIVGGSFTIPQGLTGNFEPGNVAVEAYAVKSEAGRRPRIDKRDSSNDQFLIPVGTPTITIQGSQGVASSPTALPAGTYTWSAEIKIQNTTNVDLGAKVQLPKPQVIASDVEDEFADTWCVWIKDVFNTAKPSNMTPEAFAAAVWDPLLGDHLGKDAALFFTSGMLSTSEDYTFLLAKRPEYDPSQTIQVEGIGSVPSMWKLTLRKSDADFDATGLWLPSTMRQAAAGDHFAFEGIELPHSYTLMAEEEVDNAKFAKLEKIKKIRPTWQVKLDPIRISQRKYAGLTPNLLLGSKEGYVLASVDYPYTSYSSTTNADGFLEYTLQATAEPTAPNRQYRYTDNFQNKLAEYFQEGETYTISVDVKADAPGYLYIDSRGSSGAVKRVQVNFNSTDGAWKRVSATVKMTGLGNNTRSLLMLGFTGIAPAGSTISIRKLCLTKGDSAVYVPAESEMVGQDGQYRKFQWAIGSETAVTGVWQDTPLTAPVGQYVWMRSGIVVPPATEPATWDAATRLTGDKGSDGQSVYMLDLSDEMMPMACDAEGNVIDTYKTSLATVYKGGASVTTGVTYSIAQASGVSATITPEGLVTPSNLIADTASIVVQAVVEGVTLQTTLSLYKVKPGTDGTNYSNNLYLNSAYKKNTDEWSLWSGSGIIAQVDGDKALVAIASSEYQIVSNKKVEVKAGEKFTLSGWIKGDAPGKLNYNYLLYTEGGNYRISDDYFVTDNDVTNTGWRFFILQFTAPRDGIASPGFGWRNTYDPTLYLKQLKWERGYNDDPVWTPNSSEMIGEKGADAVVYQLQPSVDNITRNALNQLSASSITVQKYKTTGASARELTTEKSIRYQRIGVDAGATTVLSGSNSTDISIPNNAALTAIVVELLDDDGVKVLHLARIPVLTDGVKETDNLVLNSDIQISTADYLVGEYTLARGLGDGLRYTFTIWGTLGDARASFQIFDSRASQKLGSLTKIADGVYSGVIEFMGFNSPLSDRRKFRVYQYPSVATSTSTIRKIKVEVGANTAPVYSRSPYDMDYLKTAMQEDSSIQGGLILASLLRMGFTDTDGVYKVMSGVNGILDTDKTLAFWAGGEMLDPDINPNAVNLPNFGVRRDGTAFAAGNTIKFLKNLIKVGDYINLDDDGLNMVINNQKRLAVGNETIDGEYVLTARTRVILSDSTVLYTPGGNNTMPAYYLYDNALSYYIPNISNITKSFTNLGSVRKGQTIAFSGQKVFLSTPYTGGSVNTNAVPALIVSYYDGNTLLTQSSQRVPQSTLSGDRLVYELPAYAPSKDISNLRITFSFVNRGTSSGLTQTEVQYKFTAESAPFSITLAFPDSVKRDIAVLGVNGTQFSWGDTHQYQQNGLWGVRVGNYGIMLTPDGIFLMTDGEKHISLKNYILGVINGTY